MDAVGPSSLLDVFNMDRVYGYHDVEVEPEYLVFVESWEVVHSLDEVSFGKRIREDIEACSDCIVEEAGEYPRHNHLVV